MMREQQLDLPPGFRAVSLRERGDAFAHACAIAGEAGAGTFVHVGRYDLIEFAVVLEPEEPLSAARRAAFAGMHALAEAVAAHCPPERELTFRWPDTLCFEGGLVGGGRLAWPDTCAEEAVPDWLVFGAMLRTVDLSHVESGEHPAGTALVSEGFELIDTEAVVGSFARHLMRAFDLWNESGFRAVGEAYLERLPKQKAGQRRLIDANGDLVVAAPIGDSVECTALLPALHRPAWYDASTGAPKLG